MSRLMTNYHISLKWVLGILFVYEVKYKQIISMSDAI
jgi:hypothetical protein